MFLFAKPNRSQTKGKIYYVFYSISPSNLVSVRRTLNENLDNAQILLCYFSQRIMRWKCEQKVSAASCSRRRTLWSPTNDAARMINMLCKQFHVHLSETTSVLFAPTYIRVLINGALRATGIKKKSFLAPRVFSRCYIFNVSDCAILAIITMEMYLCILCTSAYMYLIPIIIEYMRWFW